VKNGSFSNILRLFKDIFRENVRLFEDILREIEALIINLRLFQRLRWFLKTFSIEMKVFTLM
jgi:hypothetical protein